ncbi:L-ascorbate metabolism protein UlaG, beta-lactamase superfamily [Rubritalea squalenifaciens DSM 18772]|uniref:L-ascorbate metabolism protein UlaG, beta-lactamase superfamily n=2 Tax=Rubritalea TaxID=361050 RepID=A0A1M6NFQ4_9BACT|nr:MBL fold metallo-hydrolase [Rubritalea squalenifaciens]SHJ94581.1 L-ascorbate metabolism protein UlaG, beta-lactamase superfamily [Rubritalea squalenifaciens DSM 18772]
MPRNNNNNRKDYAGLMPRRGWVKRNIHFFRHRVFAQVFKKRLGSVTEPILDPPPVGTTRITWIGHASFLLQFAEHSVLVDPNWAGWHGIVKRQREPGMDINLVPLVDLVLVSHAHFDHLHKKSLKIVDSHEGIVVPKGSATLVKKLGFSDIHEMALWDSIQFGDLNVTHTPSHHWGARYIHDTHRDYGGYIIKSDDLTIFHCGDSAYFEGFKEIGEKHDIDIALMPIGAYEAPSGRDVHMNPEEAITAFQELNAGIMIPMHYRTFPLGNEPYHEPEERLIAEAERLGLQDRVLVLEEGVAMELSPRLNGNGAD